jgi:predicted dehydrogenase
VLVVGAGRMGKRHIQGLASGAHEVHAVDPWPEARSQATALGATAHESIEEALYAGPYSAAVMAETAGGRLERLELLVGAGIRALLVEKPVEQSRERVRQTAELVRSSGVEARVNHFFRSLPIFEELRGAGGPNHVAVLGGAWGLACNGIHWIDLACYLSADAPGRLLYAALDRTPIASGRGPEFRDWGGRALFGFDDGTRLYLDSAAESSAPMHAVITGPARQTVLLPHEERALLYERDAAESLPAYRYGAGYSGREIAALEGESLVGSTRSWATAIERAEESALPDLERSVRAHDLLFDLLELEGEREFPIT